MKKAFLSVLAVNMMFLINAVEAAKKIKCQYPDQICVDQACLPTVKYVNDFIINKEKNNDVALTTKTTWNASHGYNQAYWNGRCNTVYSNSCNNQCTASLKM